MELKRLYDIEDALIAQLLDSYTIGAVPRKAVKDELTNIQNKIKTLYYGSRKRARHNYKH